MEIVQSVRAAVRPQDWTCSIDLQDAYLHVPIHPVLYRYLQLVVSPTEVHHFTTQHSASSVHTNCGECGRLHETDVQSARSRVFGRLHLLAKLQQELTIFRSQIFVTPRNFQSLLGLLNFLALLVILGCLRMRPLQFCMSQQWDHSLLSIGRPVKVTSELRDVLEICSDTARQLQGVPLISQSPDR